MENKKTRASSSAQGLDPPMICFTEALLSSAVKCRMMSIQFQEPITSLLTEALISELLPVGGTWRKEKYYPTDFLAQAPCTQY